MIRDATPDDHAMVEDVQRRASLVWDDTRDALLAHPDAFGIPLEHLVGGQTRVAVRDGAIVGFATVLPGEEDDDRELDGLFVLPELMRTGIGRALVDDAASRAAASGASRLAVVANRNAEAFYRACGFTGDEVVETRFAPGLRLARFVGSAPC